MILRILWPASELLHPPHACVFLIHLIQLALLEDGFLRTSVFRAPAYPRLRGMITITKRGVWRVRILETGNSLTINPLLKGTAKTRCTLKEFDSRSTIPCLNGQVRRYSKSGNLMRS